MDIQKTFYYRYFNCTIIDLDYNNKKEYKKIKIFDVAKEINRDVKAIKASFLANFPKEYKGGIRNNKTIELYFTRNHVNQTPYKLLLQEVKP